MGQTPNCWVHLYLIFKNDVLSRNKKKQEVSYFYLFEKNPQNTRILNITARIDELVHVNISYLAKGYFVSADASRSDEVSQGKVKNKQLDKIQ